MTVTGSSAGGSLGPYRIRAFEPGDEPSFLALYRDVFDSDRTAAWFDWKYRSNPYVDRVPILVAERDGRLVGARPFFPLRMRVSGEDHHVLQPADAMVHPDHRRRGLFIRLTEAGLSRFGDRVAFFFNFPNPQSLPGNLALGWGVVGELPSYYRIHDPTALVRSSPGRLQGLAGACLTRATSGWLRASDLIASVPDGISVRRERSVPPGPMTALYHDHPPGGIHARRDESFYRWRFRSAPNGYRTYLATRGSDPVCAVVVTDASYRVVHLTQIVDSAPVSFDGADARLRAGLRAALRAIVRDARDAAAIVSPALPFPTRTMISLGFLPRHTPILSRVTNESAFVARSSDAPNGTPSQTLAGVDLLDRSAWDITFAEHDNR